MPFYDGARERGGNAVTVNEDGGVTITLDAGDRALIEALCKLVRERYCESLTGDEMVSAVLRRHCELLTGGKELAI